jgi:hypothetical protein
MTTTIDHQRHEFNPAGARRRQIRVMQVIFAGAATVAMFALFDAARPGAAETIVTSGPVRLVDQATDLPAPAAAPFGPQFPQAGPNVVGNGGFAADADDDDAQQQAEQAQQQADQEEQQATQQMDQELNDQAEQQFVQDELQAQQTEQQAQADP